MLYLQPHVQADVDIQANVCDDSSILRAHAGVEPRFTFTVEGGIQADIVVRVSAWMEVGREEGGRIGSM